jgi:amidophosphoribosyltransferase
MRKSIYLNDRDFGVREECGVLGVSSIIKKDLAKDIYFGLFALQHRGQESAGIAVQAESNSVEYYKEIGLVNEVFTNEKLSGFPKVNVGIGHVRYSSVGSNHVINAQPVVFYGRKGRMAVAYNGSILNTKEIKQKMLNDGHIFQSSVNSEVLAALINYHSKDSIKEGIIKTCKELKGAFAFVVFAENKLYAARDHNGLKPLVLGKRGSDIIFASESCALDALDAELVRDVVAGEIISVDNENNLESYFYNGSEKNNCIFEYVYLARADSVMDGVSVYDARYNCGKKLAALYKIDADMVSGVPDSALQSARGYSNVSGIPYVDALSKNQYVKRTFIQPSQSMREASVKIKLSVYKNNVQGKRIILIDDSIVRGTTSRKIINLLRQNGAKEVHMLVASPMVVHTCHFGVDMQTGDNIIAYFKTKDEICKLIGADSLNYLPLEDLRASCCGAPNEFCTGCFDGQYPMEVDG